VENYKKYLVLAKDKSNLKEFAKRQESIFQLEHAKLDAFNTAGPTSQIYISTSNKLFDLYIEEEEYEEALDIAKELFDLVKTSSDVATKSKVIVNLGIAYLKNGNIAKAKKVATEFTFHELNPLYPQYCLFRATLAQVYKNKEEELEFLLHSYTSAIEKEQKTEEISNILIAIALYYERNGMSEKAYLSYLEIFHKASSMALEFTDEERFSFLIRLSRLAIANNNTPLAINLLTSSLPAMKEKLSRSHPLIKLAALTLKKTEKAN